MRVGVRVCVRKHITEFYCAAALVSVALLVSGCAQSRNVQTYQPCEIVAGSATSYGRGLSLRYAENSFKSQLPDVRGEFVGAGLRRTRLGPKRVTCQPYRLFGGVTSLTTCTVQARLCGR
jgi:hypothetical protein